MIGTAVARSWIPISQPGWPWQEGRQPSRDRFGLNEGPIALSIRQSGTDRPARSVTEVLTAPLPLTNHFSQSTAPGVYRR